MRHVLASKAFCLGTHTHRKKAVKTVLDFCESLYLLRPALMYEEYCLLWYTREISPVSCPPMLYLRIYTSDRLVWIWILKIVSTFTVQNWSSSDLKARATNNCLNLSIYPEKISMPIFDVIPIRYLSHLSKNGMHGDYLFVTNNMNKFTLEQTWSRKWELLECKAWQWPSMSRRIMSFIFSDFWVKHLHINKSDCVHGNALNSLKLKLLQLH